MNKHKLEKLNLEELKKKKQQLQISLFVVILIMLALVIFSVFFKNEQGDNNFVFIPAIFIPLLTINLVMLKKVKTEIGSRE